MKLYAALYHDFQNVGLSPEQIPILHQRLIEKYNLLIRNVYNTWNPQKHYLLTKNIREIKFQMIYAHPIKNEVDNLIIKDGKEDISSDRRIRLLILITGDKDFLPLVKEAKELEIKVMLIYRCANANKKLIDAVDEAYEIDELLSSINVDKTIIEEKSNSPMMIPYDEAKKCLLELIKKVQIEGKKANLGLIGKLMKEHPRLSKYKKVSSIAKPNGGKFSKLSQFVEAVVQEGSIINTRGNLILVKS